MAVLLGVAMISGVPLWWMIKTGEDDKILQQRGKLREKCVNVGLIPKNTNGRSDATKYKIEFTSEFYCPDSAYTPLDALTRAEIVLEKEGLDIQLTLRETVNGVVIDTMLGKVNGQPETWVLYANGRRITDPLDSVVLQRGHSLLWYYEAL